MRRLPVVLIAALVLLPAAASDSASHKRCNTTTGTELAHSTVVKVYKVSRGGTSYQFFGCARPRGLVFPLTHVATGKGPGGQVKLVAAKAAYVAFQRTISRADTLSVVDARTGRQRHGLFPPEDIEFDADPQTPQIGAVRLNSNGELAVGYIGLGAASSPGSTTYVYAFDASGDEQLLDSGPGTLLPPKSIKLNGETVTWTHSGVTRSATIGEASLNVISGGGSATGDVTTSPDGGIACHVAQAALTGVCVGSYATGTDVTITATGPATSTVTISGACSAVHAPVAAQPSSVATCTTRLSNAATAKVTFG